MKHRILAIAITFFFGIATSILLCRVGCENVRAGKGTNDQIVHSAVNKLLSPISSVQKNPAKK